MCLDEQSHVSLEPCSKHYFVYYSRNMLTYIAVRCILCIHINVVVFIFTW